MSRVYREDLVGTELEVLFEEEEKGHFTGHAPNYVKVYTQGTGLHNEIRTVRITAVYQDGVMGDVVG